MDINAALKKAKDKINSASKSEKLVWAKHIAIKLAPDLVVLTMLAIAIGFTPWLITCICMLILACIVKIYASYKMLEKENIKITQLDNNMNTFIRDMLISVAIGAACLISMIFFPAFGAIACYVTIAAGITAAVIELVEGAVNIWKIWKLGSTVTDEEAEWLNATAAEANSN